MQDSNDLYARFLNLTAPALSAEIVEYLLEPGELEKFIGLVTMLGDPVEIRQFCSDSICLKLAYKITTVLAFNNDLSNKLLQEPRLLHSLLLIFDKRSRGSFMHFRKIFMAMVNKNPAIISTLFLDEEPYILKFLDYITYPEVSDCFIAAFLRLLVQQSLEEQELVFEKLLQVDFIPTFISLILQNTILCEVFTRMVRATADMKHSHVMYQGLPKQLLLELNSKFLDGKEEFLDLFHAIFYTRYASQFQEPKSLFAKNLLAITETECELLAEKLPLSQLTKLVDIFSFLIINNGKIQRNIPWRHFLKIFLIQHNANIFHAAFLRLFKACVKYKDTEFLQQLEHFEFFNQLDESRSKSRGNTAFIDLMIECKSNNFVLSEKEQPCLDIRPIQKSTWNTEENEIMPLTRPPVDVSL